MSFSHPNKKRALAPLPTETAAATPPASLHRPLAVPRSGRQPLPTSGNTTTTSSASKLFANMDASVYKAELEHVRSLRALDAKRATQLQQRLERQVQFAQEEAEAAKVLLEEEREQSAAHMEQLRQARDEALQQLHAHQQAGYDHDDDDDAAEVRLWQQKCQSLEAQLDSKQKETESLNEEIHELREHLQQTLEKADNAVTSSKEEPVGAYSPTSSAAPEPVLKELNRVRIQLAESERKQRQLRRSVEEWQQKAKQLLPEREAARAANLRVKQLDIEVQTLRATYETTKARNEQWKELGTALAHHLEKKGKGGLSLSTTSTEYDDEHSTDEMINTPPEISTVLRHLENFSSRTRSLEHEKRALEERVEKLKGLVRPLEEKIQSYDDKEAQWGKERQNWQMQVDRAEKEIDTLKAQESIWKREIDGLKSLVKTFDDLPISTSSLVGGGVASTEAALRTAQLELASVKEELELLKKDRDRVAQELSTALEERETQTKEIDRIKEKYGKLREALQGEKEKSQLAEARACRAEELAGKGSFNPDETQVLHLSKNPLSATLKEQNKSLKQQLEAALKAGGEATAKAATGSEVDPNKLHKRLKDSFSKTIALFREGVHLITGFKIDMIDAHGDRPRFRVRSRYAENESDELLFQWPKDFEAGAEVTSLDLLHTDFAKFVATTPNFEYIKKYDSLPAFAAAVQLDLFEKQTTMG